MTATLHISLLGDFRLTYGDEPIWNLNTARLQALLAYLVLHAGAPQSRQHLSFCFWPDSTEQQARTNLRQLLHYLRHTLPDAARFIEADMHTVRWNSDAAFTLDVVAFEQASTRGSVSEEQTAPDAVRKALEEAVGLYTGDLLPSCYDEWIEPTRERLRQQYIVALDRLVHQLEEQRVYLEAIRYARLLLQKDPLRETTYRSLMRLHALRRDRASALRVYHECASVLERELGVAPSPATRELHERLVKVQAPATPRTNTRSPAFAAEVPLVGRQPEWEQLQSARRRARSGQAHFVSIVGEAGIGKTRLAEELMTWTGRQGMTTAWTRCYAAEGHLAFAPVSDWLRTSVIRKALGDVDAVWRTEVARILPELLTEDPNLPHPEPLAESWQRRRFFEALAHSVLAARHPMLLLIDDLQWCDRDTLEWIHYLLHFKPEVQLLVLSTIRVEEVGAGHALETLLLDLRRTGQLTEIVLGALNVAETAQLAEHVADRMLDAGHAAYLYRETEGHPLFVVEGVRAGLIATNERVAQRTQKHAPLFALPELLPPKVQAILAARMAQLSPTARELAHLAAVVGRAFTFEVLLAASGHDEDALVRDLDELWQRRIVREQGGSSYDFSHDKLREVAYAAVSPARRRLLHRRVAEALVNVHGVDLDAISGQLAVHYERAGVPERAIPYYQQAAQVVQRIHANEEAIGYLNRALDLLEMLPGGPQRDEREVVLRTLLGPSLVATKGWANPDVGQVYARARVLCQPGSDPVQLLTTLWGLLTFHIVRSELETARELGEELLHLAQHQDDAALLVAAHLALGICLFHLGELVSAREHLEQALGSDTSQQNHSRGFSFGPDLGVFSLCYISHVLWHLGCPGQALERIREAMIRADALAHPFSQAVALDYAAMLHQFRNEPEAARVHTEAAIALCEEHGFAYYLAWGMIIRGWAWSEQNRSEEGRAAMRQGLADLRATGARLRQPYHLALLAEAIGTGGDVEGALSFLDEALTLAHANGERWQEAELHRLKGELLLDRDAGEAEIRFRTARELAQSQGARALALRVAMSLSRFWQRRGRSDEARTLLEGAYNAFTEGFDTADLQEARALLDGTA